MGSYAVQGNTQREEDVLHSWDPRMEDYLDWKSSTISSHGPGANFSRSANLARNREMVSEPRGVYVRNIPCSMTSNSLHKMFSEHGKVLSVFIGYPRAEFLPSQVTWAIIRVENMKDAMTMVSAMHQKPPLNLRVALAMTEEEKQKHKREKELERKHQQEMEGITSSRLSANDCKLLTSQFKSTSGRLPNGVGRGKWLSSMSVRPKGSHFMNQQQGEENIAPPLKDSNTSLTASYSPVPDLSACQPRTRAVVEMGCGTVAVGWRQPRPCVCCGAQGQLRCSVCKAWYCGKLCQVDDWYYHREKCCPPPPLEGACSEFKDGRNVPICIRQAESKDSLLPNKLEKPKVSLNESNNCMSLDLQPSERKGSVGIENEKQDRQISGNGGQEILNEKFRQQTGFHSHINIKNHTYSSSPEQSMGLFGKMNTQETEIKECDAHMTPTSIEIPDRFCEKKNIQETKNKIQNASMTVSIKENPNRVLDPDTSSVSYRAIRNRTCMPSTGKLRRPHHAEFNAVGEIPSDKENRLSKELCVSSEKICIEQVSSSQNTINKHSKCDENIQTVPHIASAKEEMTRMIKVSASCTKVSHESSTYSSDDIPHLASTSPVEKAVNITSSRVKMSIPVLSSLSEKLNSGTVYEGIITSFDSYKQFTAVVKADQAEFIFNEAQEVLDNIPYDPNFKPEVGCIVAALSSSDNSWYRAYVHELVAGKYNVYYIDFGNMEMVEVTKLLPPGLFTELPGLAMVAKLHSEVDIKVQNQLQSIVMINRPITFMVLGKKSKSLKVSLLGCDTLDRVTDYILRPWYSSLPLENSNTLSCTSTPSPPSRLPTKCSTLGAAFQDKKDFDLVEMHRKQNSLDSQGKISPSKPTDFIPLSVEKASGKNTVYQVNMFSADHCDAKNKLEGSTIEKLGLDTATGPESSNRRDENTETPFPGLGKEIFDGHSLCDPRTSSDTPEISKKEGNMNYQKSSKVKGAVLCSESQGTNPCQGSEKFWAKDLSRTEVKHGKEYTVLPVWVTDDNELCVHLVTEASALEVQMLTRNITQHCETGSMPRDIQIGELVCGFVMGDGLWYRAEVIDIQSDCVTVHLVDFGNSEIIPKKNIRGYAADFMQLPSICVKVKLSGISKENVESRRNMQALVESQSTLIMYSQGETQNEFELFDPQQKIFLNNRLFSCTGRKTAGLEKPQEGVIGVASPLTSGIMQENKDPSSISQPSAEAINSPSSKESCKDPSSISLPSTETFKLPSSKESQKDPSSISLSLTKAIKSPSLKEPCTTVGSSTPLHLSSPVQLPAKVQSSPTVNSKTLVQSSMLVEEPTPDQSTNPEQPIPTRHLFVDAKQSSSISSITSASPAVPMSNPNQDRASALNSDAGKTSIITQHASTTLISQTNGNSVTSQKSKDGVQGFGSKAPMYDECKSTTLPVADYVTVVVLEAVNPHTIFVVPMESLHLFDELEEMMTAMNEYCNSRQGCLYRPKQGELCLAKFSQDGKWYRAACVSPGQENALVIFIDFANREIVLHSNIQQIPQQFLELPCLALHCSLSGVSVNDMKEEASVRLRELLPPNSPAVVDVLKHNEDGTYTIAKPAVTDVLVSEGLVKPE